jgi:outer membrane protein
MTNQIIYMKAFVRYIFIILLAVSIELSGQPVNLNSVTEAIDYALNNNPDLEIYKHNLSKAKYDYNSVKNYWMPDVNATFAGENNINLPVTPLPGEIFGQPGKTVEAEFGQQFSYNTGINISKNILDFRSRFSAKIAEVNVEIAEANENVFKQKLAEQVAFNYYTAIITDKALKVQKSDYVTSKEILTIVEQKFDQGIVDQLTVNLAKINKNNISKNLNSYNIALEQCKSNLKILFGLESKTEITFNEQLEPHELIIHSIDNINPDKGLQIYQLQKRQSDYKLTQQKTNFLPTLSINGYYGAQQYRDNFGLSFNGNDWSKISNVSLNLSIPIFTGFSTKNKVSSASIDYEIARNTLDQELLKSKIEDDLIIKEFNNSKNVSDVARDNYQLTKENAELQFQKFEQGVVSLDNYLDSFDDYLKAEVTYLNLLSDLYNYYSKILSRNF